MDIEIDLHGLTYNEVHEVLMNKVILHYNKGNIPIRIITGKSEKMKTIVREQCKNIILRLMILGMVTLEY